MSSRRATEEEHAWAKKALASHAVLTPGEFVDAFFILLSGEIPDSEIVSTFSDALRAYGIESVTVLASGSSALAGKPSPDKVLKLTFDESDALASKRISGKVLPNVAAVDDAVLLHPEGLWRPVGIILEDYAGWPGLAHPGDDDDLNDLVYNSNQDNKVWRVFQNQVRGKTAERIMKKAVNDIVKKLEKDGRDAFMEIANGLKWLVSNGVYMVDPNSSNVAYGDDGLKLIDLGLSYTIPAPLEK